MNTIMRAGKPFNSIIKKKDQINQPDKQEISKSPQKNGYPKIENDENLYKNQHLTEIMQSFKTATIKNKEEREKRLCEIVKTNKLEDAAPERVKEYMKEAKKELFDKHLQLLRSPATISDFIFFEQIGTGGFGSVHKVQHRKTLEIYALKRVKKSKVSKKNERVRMFAERDILSQVESQYVVKLFYTFQDETSLFQVLEYLEGKSFMHWLAKLNYFSEQTVKFYMAELVQAVMAVHKLGFVHRDIKPDNLVLNRHGHLKLLDFGLAKYSSNTHRIQSVQTNKKFDFKSLHTYFNSPPSHMLKSRCGTIFYQAPEVLKGLPYDSKVDWWSVGIIMFESLYGGIPFLVDPNYKIAHSVKIEMTKKMVLSYKETCPIPYIGPNIPTISDDAIDLLRKLICEPEVRIDGPQILNHRWFNDFNFNTIYNQPGPLFEEIQNLIYTQKNPNKYKGILNENRPNVIKDLLFTHYEFSRELESSFPTIEKLLENTFEKMSKIDKKLEEK